MESQVERPNSPSFKQQPARKNKITTQQATIKNQIQYLNQYYNIQNAEQVAGIAFDKKKSLQIFQINNFMSKKEQKILDTKTKEIKQQAKNEAKTYTYGQIWLLCSHAKYLYNIPSAQYYKYYEQINKSAKYPDFFIEGINKDLPRTNIDGQKEEIILPKMLEVLKNFCRRNPYVGYCQGMNFIVAFFIKMGFSNEECFWLISCLIENILPIDYYTSMLGVLYDSKIFFDLIYYHNERIYNKFKELCFEPSVIVIQWFICIFTTTLKENIVKVIFDHLFTEGNITLFKAALIILDFCEKAILAANEFPEVIMGIEKNAKLINDEESFNLLLHNIYLHKDTVELAREIQRNQVKLNYDKQQKRRLQNLKKEWLKQKCNVVWPICHHILEKNKQIRSDVPLFVFRNQNIIQKINDHFDLKNCSRKQRNTVNFDKLYSSQSLSKKIVLPELEGLDQGATEEFVNDMLLGRHHHICDPVKYKLLQYQQAQQNELNLKQYRDIQRQFQNEENQQKVVQQQPAKFVKNNQENKGEQSNTTNQDKSKQTENQQQQQSHQQAGQKLQASHSLNSNEIEKNLIQIKTQEELEQDLDYVYKRLNSNEGDSSEQENSKYEEVNPKELKRPCGTIMLTKDNEKIYRKYQQQLDSTQTISFYNGLNQEQTENYQFFQNMYRQSDNELKKNKFKSKQNGQQLDKNEEAQTNN